MLPLLLGLNAECLFHIKRDVGNVNERGSILQDGGLGYNRRAYFSLPVGMRTKVRVT